MDDFQVREKLREYVADGEPPMSLTSDGLLAQAARLHRLRVLGGGATSLAVIAALFFFVPTGNAPPPPSWPTQSMQECLSRVPLLPEESRQPTSPRPDGTGLPPAPSTDEERSRVACYTVDTVLGLLPGVSFLPNNGRYGKGPFDPADDGAGLALDANSRIGTVVLTVGRRDPSGTDIPDDANIAETRQRKQTLPDGTLVIVDDQQAHADGFKHVSVEVWSAGTHILVASDNFDRQTRQESAGPTLLTADQLTSIATAPELRLYG